MSYLCMNFNSYLFLIEPITMDSSKNIYRHMLTTFCIFFFVLFYHKHISI